MKTIEETVDAIREVARQIGFSGQNWKRLLDALNTAGVTSRRGQPWKHIQAVQQWCSRNGVFPSQTDRAEQLELAADEMQAHVEDIEKELTQAVTETPAPRKIYDNVQLTTDEIAAMRQMIAAWRDKQAVLVFSPEQPTYRPAFPGERDNTGIRVNRRLLRAALEKARTEDAALTGGGKLSPLIEHLLWGYLGYDPKFLKP